MKDFENHMKDISLGSLKEYEEVEKISLAYVQIVVLLGAAFPTAASKMWKSEWRTPTIDKWVHNLYILSLYPLQMALEMA